MKLLTFVLAIILCLTSYTVISFKSNYDIEEYIYEFQNLKLETIVVGVNYTKVSLDKCFPIGEIGEPEIPSFITQLLISNNRRIKSIEVQNIDFEEIVLSYPILPIQEVLPLSTDYRLNFSINEETYEMKNKIVNKLSEKDTKVNYMKGYPILSITVYPLDYIPSTNTLIYYKTIKVIVIYEKDNNFQLNDYFRGTDSNTIEDLVDNPNDIDSYNTVMLPLADAYPGGLCDSSDTYHYVIITNNDLKSTTGSTYNWSSLLNHRATFSGLTGIIVTVEDIYACSDYWNVDPIFNDSQALIREFCKDAYLDWSTEYILLGGDWDTSGTQIVPFREFLCGYGTTGNGVYACDLYYANLDGDWYANDGYFGGYAFTYGHDIYSELIVSRLTVSTSQQISNAVTKIIWYDMYSDDEFLKNVGFFGGNLGWPVTSAEYMEDIRNGTGDYYTETDGFVQWNDANPAYDFNISTREYYDWGATIPNDWITLINSNSVSIINHLGHGNPFYTLGSMSVSSLTNSKYIFIYTQECSSGRFKEGDTMEKYWTVMSTNYGAVSTVQNTGYGWGSGVSTDGPNQYVQRCFWDYMFNETILDWVTGKAFTYAKNMVGIRCNAGGTYGHHGAWYGSTLFGDPALRLKSRLVGSEHDCGIIINNVYGSNKGVHVNFSGEYIVNATVYNFGNVTETNINVSLKQDDVYKTSIIIPSLEKNSLTKVSLNWTTPSSDADGIVQLSVNVTIPIDGIPSNNQNNKTMIIGPDIGVSAYSYDDVMKYYNSTFSAIISNNGFTNKSVTVKFTVNDTEEDSRVISLNTTEEKEISFLWNGSEYSIGKYYVNISVTPVDNEVYLLNQFQSIYIRLYSKIQINNITFTPDRNSTTSYVNVSCEVIIDEEIVSKTITIDSSTYNLENFSDNIYYYNKSSLLKGYYYFTISISSSFYTETNSSYFVVYDTDSLIWNQNTSTSYKTIREAIDVASENETIRVPSSKFKGSILVNKSVCIEGNSSSSMIDGENSYGFILNTTGANNVHIINLTFNNCSSGIYIFGESDRSWGSVYFDNYSHSNVVRGCSFNNSTRGVYIQGSQYNQVYNNTFETNLQYGLILSYESSAIVQAGYNEVHNNTFLCSEHSIDYGIRIFIYGRNNISYNNFYDTPSKSMHYGIYITDSNSNNVFNNTFNLSGKNAMYLRRPDRLGLGGKCNNIYNNNITHISSTSGYDTSAIFLTGSSRGEAEEYIHDNYIYTKKHGITCANTDSRTRGSFLRDNVIERIINDDTIAYGIYIYDSDGGNEKILSCDIKGYTTAIYVVGSFGSESYVNFCNFYDNNQYGVYNSLDLILNAKYCFWNSTDGPGGVGPGSGEAISSNVLYLPFNTYPYDGIPNTPPVLLNVSPENASLNISINPKLNFTTGDYDGDIVNFSVHTNSSGTWNLIQSVNETKSYGPAVYTDFETTNDNWIPRTPSGDEEKALRFTVGSNAHSGTKVAKLYYFGVAGVQSIRRNLLLSDYNFVNVSFWFNMWSVGNGDYLKVLYYDGTTTTTVQAYHAIDFEPKIWYEESLQLSSLVYNFNDDARIYFKIEGSLTMGDELYLDDVSINISNSVGNYSISTNMFTEYFRTYYWSINATDENGWNNETFYFTIEGTTNKYPQFINEFPLNETVGEDTSLDVWNITIFDTEGDLFNWTIETSPDIGSNSGNDDTNGSKSVSISGLAYSTTYKIYVNATDSYTYNREWYTFTTRNEPGNNTPPSVVSSYPSNNSKDVLTSLPYFRVYISDIDGDTMNITWKTNITGEWTTFNVSIDIENGTHYVYNTSWFSKYSGKCYWKLEVNDGMGGWNNKTYIFTTLINSAPVISLESPINNSINQPLHLTWSVQITDTYGDVFSYWLNCSNGQSFNSTTSSNGVKTLLLSELSYNTQYYVWVNATDGIDWNRKWFAFTTKLEPETYLKFVELDEDDFLDGGLFSSDMFYLSVTKKINENTEIKLPEIYLAKSFVFWRKDTTINTVIVYGMDDLFMYSKIEYTSDLDSISLEVDDISDYNAIVFVPNPGYFQSSKFYFELLNNAKSVYLKGEML